MIQQSPTLAASMTRGFLNDAHLPLVLKLHKDSVAARSKQALCDYAVDHRDELDNLLLEYGGILFRGFDVGTAEDFSDVLDTLLDNEPVGDDEPKGHAASDGNKSHVTRNVYTSTEQPVRHRILQHNEDSCTDHPPRHVVSFARNPR